MQVIVSTANGGNCHRKDLSMIDSISKQFCAYEISSRSDASKARFHMLPVARLTHQSGIWSRIAA
jgi:hypothetical protein